MIFSSSLAKHGWKECKLGEIIEIVGGGTPKTSIPEYWNGNIPWLSVVDFNTGNKYVYKTEKTITQKGLENSSTRMLSEGDIIISARGTVGALAVLKKQMAFNQSCYGIRGIPDISNQDYVYYLIKDSINNLQQIAHGGVFDTITRETFYHIAIVLPPLPEQRAIAGVLSSLDDKIDLLHRQNKTLEGIAESLWRKMFVKDADPKWMRGKLGEFITVKGGTTPSTTNPEFWNGNINWVTPRDLSGSHEIFLHRTERMITEKGLMQIGSGLLPTGTVLLSSRAPIGYLTISNIPVAINQGYIAVICDRLFSNYYMFLWIKSNMDIIIGSANGSTFLEISKSVFKDLDVEIPPEYFILDFNSIVKPQFDKILSNELEIRTLSHLRDALLPKLMSGEARVRYERGCFE